MQGISRRGFLAAATVGTLTAAAIGTATDLSLSAEAVTGASSAPTPTPILTRHGSELRVHGQHRRLSGVNAYWLGLNDNARDSNGDPVLPSHSVVTSAFAGMRGLGTTIVRAHTVGISAGTPRSFMTAPGTFSDANLDSADWAIYEAGKRGILLMVPMTDQWNYYHGGKGVFVHWAHQQNGDGVQDVPAPGHLFDADGAEKGSVIEDQFFASSTSGLRIRALFKDYLTHWLDHVNPYTGLAYKDDPTIAIIETGNEIYSATAEWTEDIARFVKSIAPHKLVADGSAATGLAVRRAPGLHAAHVDIVGAHYYAQHVNGSPAPLMTAISQLSHDVSAAKAAGKVFILGEYPWTRSDIRSWYSRVERNPNIGADLTWAFIGGTEQHGGAFGTDDFAVHWPYRGTEERLHGPTLARHISSMSSTATLRAALR